MKGVIFEIKKNKTIVMKRNGSFIEVPTQDGWQTGDVITVRAQTIPFKKLLAIAACLLVVVGLVAGAGYYTNYYNETTALVSIDVNPSIELAVNRTGKVTGVTAVNDDGERIVEVLNLEGLSYRQATECLLQSPELQQYLARDPYMMFTVHTENGAQTTAYVEALWEVVGSALPGEKEYVDIRTVNSDTVQQAHTHGVSAGKYLLLQELLDANPELDIEEYSHCGVGELHQHIAQHSSHGQDGGHHEGHQDGVENSGSKPENTDTRSSPAPNSQTTASPDNTKSGHGGKNTHH